MKKNTLLILITAFYIACFIGVMSLLNEKIDMKRHKKAYE